MRGASRHLAAEFILLWLIVAGAAGLRCYYVHTYAGDGSQPAPLRVQEPPTEEFTALVRSLNQGKGFGGPSRAGAGDGKRADAAPFYPWLLAQLSQQPADLAILYERMRWVQCALGALTAGLLFLFARHAFGSVVAATVTGVAAAVYPFWILSAAEINDGVLTTFFLALALYLVARCQFEEIGASWLYGMALAALALTRAALLPFSLTSLAWFLLRCRAGSRQTLPAILVFIGFVSGLAPWMVRNYEVTGTILPIVDSTYYHLVMGNRPGATGGPAPKATVEEQAMSDRERGQIVLSTMTSDPAGTLRRRLWAGLCFTLGEDWLTKQTFVEAEESPEESAPLVDACRVVLPATLLGLFFLAGLGWRWSYARRSRVTPAALAVILIPLPYVIGHAEALSGPRLPLDAVLICLGAYAITWMTSLGRSPSAVSQVSES